MIVTQCSAADVNFKKSPADCTKEERQYLCHMLRELIENTNELKVDFGPAIRCAAKAVGAVGLTAVGLLVSMALFGKAGLALELASGPSPGERSMLDSISQSGRNFVNQLSSDENEKALQKANKLKNSIQIFAENTNIDLSQVISQIDSFVAQSQELSWSNKRQIRNNKDLLSQIFVDDASVFEAVQNSEGLVSRIARKALR